MDRYDWTQQVVLGTHEDMNFWFDCRYRYS